MDAFDANNDGALDDAWLAGCARAPGAWVHGNPCLAPAVMRTTDGGLSWDNFVLGSAPGSFLAIEMADTELGWAVGKAGLLAHSTDGGATWTPEAVPANSELYGISVRSRDLAFAAGDEHVILRYQSGSSTSISATAQQNTFPDGDLSDWTSTGAVGIDADNAHTVVGTPPAPADLSGSLRARWWEDKLFLAVDVTDDNLGGDDRVEIAVDGKGDGLPGGGDDHHFRFYADGRVSNDGVALIRGVQTGGGGYRLEVEIPAASLGGRLESGRKVGLNVGLFDHDGGQQRALILADSTVAGNPAAFASLSFSPFGSAGRTLLGLPAGAMTLDGNLGEWSADQTMTLNSGSAANQQGQSVSASDLSAGVRSRWWTDYLFLGIDVKDETLRAGDAVHLAFDGDQNGEKGGATDWEMRIGADGSVAGGYLALAFVQQKTGGYQVEIAVPKSMLGGTLAHERSLGFNIGLADDDSGDSRPESWLIWEGASPGGVFADLGEIQLEAYSLTLQPGQNGYAGVTDTVLDSWEPSTNHGADATLEWRGTTTAPAKSGLVKFNLSGLPAGIVVNKATLSYNATLRRRTRPHGEGFSGDAQLGCERGQLESGGGGNAVANGGGAWRQRPRGCAHRFAADDRPGLDRV